MCVCAVCVEGGGGKRDPMIPTLEPVLCPSHRCARHQSHPVLPVTSASSTQITSQNKCYHHQQPSSPLSPLPLCHHTSYFSRHRHAVTDTRQFPTIIIQQEHSSTTCFPSLTSKPQLTHMSHVLRHQSILTWPMPPSAITTVSDVKRKLFCFLFPHPEVSPFLFYF